jgi:glycosyltransferase involved in cell wall biosynthesis
LYFSIPLRRCAVITAISEETRDRIAEAFPFAADRVVVIPCPVLEGYMSRPKPFNASYPRILQVGTAPHKNVDRLVQAICGLPCKLHLIGRLDNEQRRLLERSQVDYENSLNISDAEMLQAYDESDIVAFVSLAEGFGMPIIEAQAMGRPVITSSLSPMKEVAGAGALTVDPYDVSAIRNVVHDVIEDATARQRATAAGLENAKRFTAKTVAGQYARLYQRVATCTGKDLTT